MRKNKTSNKNALKLSVVVIGLGTAMGAMAFTSANTPTNATTNATTNAPSNATTNAPSTGTNIANTVNGAINSATSAINGAVSSITGNGGANGTNNTVTNNTVTNNTVTNNTVTNGSVSGSTFNSGTQQAAGTIATTAVVPQYSQAQLDAAGCDAGVWSKMVADYQREAAQIAALDTEQLTRQLVKATPPISSMASCFDQAANIINSATAIYTTITKLLTGGGLDSNQLLQYGENLLTKYACSLVDSYIASTGIAGTLNGINNLPNQVLGTNVGVGGINTNVGNILQGGGYQQGQGSPVGQVTGGQLAGTISNAASNVVPGFK